MYLSICEDGAVVAIQHGFYNICGTHFIEILLFDIGTKDSIEIKLLWWFCITRFGVFEGDETTVRKGLRRTICWGNRETMSSKGIVKMKVKTYTKLPSRCSCELIGRTRTTTLTVSSGFDMTSELKGVETQQKIKRARERELLLTI
jgi:hypothetical protein